jgi:hypothetical protein
MRHFRPSLDNCELWSLPKNWRKTLAESRQLVEEFQANIAKAQKVVEDSRRLIEENRIILEKAKRLVK